MRGCAFIALLRTSPFSALPDFSCSAQTFGGIGTRAEGMGGAFVAVADDASAVYWNPAGHRHRAPPSIFRSPVAGPGSTVFVGARCRPRCQLSTGPSGYRSHTVQAPADRQNEGSGRCASVLSRPRMSASHSCKLLYLDVVIGTTARLVAAGVEGFETARRSTSTPGPWCRRACPIGLTARNSWSPNSRRGGAGADEAPGPGRGGVRPASLPPASMGRFRWPFDADLTTTPASAGDARMAAVGGEYWLAQGLVGLRGGVRWSTLDGLIRRFRAV